MLMLWISVTEHGSAALVGSWRVVRAELAEVHDFRSIGWLHVARGARKLS